MSAEPVEPVRRIGIRELQKNAGAVLRELTDSGEVAEITSRGQVVARLTPVSAGEAVYNRMVASGEIIPPMRQGGLLGREPLPPRSDGRTATDVLLAMREEESW